MAVVIPGRYDFVSTDKYDEFLKAVDVSLINRTLANKAKPALEYIDHGNNKWTQRTISLVKNFEITFNLGETFVEETADGRKVNATITKDGDTLIHKQELNGETAEVTRVFKPDGTLTCTFAAKGVIATRVYKKVA